MMKEVLAKKKPGKAGLEDRFEEEFSQDSMDEEGVFLKPPVLYVRPKLEDIKEMMRAYMEGKKML